MSIICDFCDKRYEPTHFVAGTKGHICIPCLKDAWKGLPDKLKSEPTVGESDV